METTAPRPLTLTAQQRLRNRQGDLVARCLLVAMWAYIVLPATLKAFTGSDFHALTAAAILGVTGLALLVIIVWFADLVENRLWLVGVSLAPAVYVAMRELYAGRFDYHVLTYAVVTVALAAARPTIQVLRTLVPLLIATAAAAFVIGVVDPSVGLAQSGREKGFVPGVGLLAGMFEQENNLGQFLALGLPLLLLVRDPRRRAVAVVVVLAPLVWSASRGSMMTAAVDLVLMALLPRIADRRLRTVAERWAVAVCAFVLAALPLLLRPDFKAFSARGGIWSTSLESWWHTNPLFGLGATWYEQMLTDSASPLLASATHAHNQLVQWAVTGGLVLLVLAGLQWTAATVVTTRPYARQDVLGAVVMSGLCVNGWLEYDFGYLDGVLFWPFTFPVLAVLLFCRDRGRPPVRRPLVTGAP